MTLFNRERLRLWAIALLPAIASLAMTGSAAAYDLQYRQNNTNFSAETLQAIFNQGLPSTYDRAFPEQQWTTYLLLDAHPDQGLVAITLGLSPRVGPSRALLPIATYSVIEPIPINREQWQRLLSILATRYATTMLNNRARLVNRP